MEDKNYEKIINANIMIIDEDVNMMEILTAVLNKYGHNVKTFTEPVSAIKELKEEKYDILLVNYLMSPVNGDKIVEIVREFNKEIYIILMSMHKDLAPTIESMQNLDIQAYFEKSARFDQLIMLIQGGIKYIEQLNKIKNMNIKLDKYLLDFAKILLNTVAAKDHYTEEHSKRVTNICRIFAKYLDLDENETDNLITASSFHDVGKIGISDYILQKQGKLNPDEFEIMKSHPIIGANIFSVSDIFKDIVPIIKHHHERIDGKGYPDNLKGDKIPKLAKILTICDSFDAIISKRCYKEAMPLEFALKEIDKNSGKQFDSYLAQKFIDMIKSNYSNINDIINNSVNLDQNIEQ